MKNNFTGTPLDHEEGCCCEACGGMRPEEEINRIEPVANEGGNELNGSGLSAPAQLSDMADYLANGFWANYGSTSRKFNLTDSGINAKSGVLHYNVSGFQNAGAAGSDDNGITNARANLVRDVLDVFSEVLGITFVETNSSSTSVTDLFFKDNHSGTAFANSAGFAEGIQYSWINVAKAWSGGTSTYNDYTLQTIFHEVGHALGLGHQGLYNGSGSYPGDADFDNDSWQSTMMSYFSQTENSSIPASFAYLQTPMAVDWIALQDIYGDQSHGGVDFGVNNAFLGNTVYGFNTNISSATSNIWAEFATYAGKTASTIIDAGGVDTLDLSGFSANQVINLSPTNRNDTVPSVSSVGGKTGNLTLGDGTIIENAVGGSGADTFYGNDEANTFTGNGGNDLFHDSAGDDTYFGGAGTDTVSFFGLFSSFSFNLSGAFLEVINVATDLVESTIEWLSFEDTKLSFGEVENSLAPNELPQANDDSFNTDEETALSGQNVLSNDTDADDDGLSVVAVNGDAAQVGVQIALVSGALLVLNADGSFDYDPNGAFDTLIAGEKASDSFTYTVSDGTGPSSPATVTISVDGVDDPEVAKPVVEPPDVDPPDVDPPVVDDAGPQSAIGQSGVATVSQSGPDEWHVVTFSSVIDDAVVVLGPVTSFGADQVTTRVRNVTDTGFEFQIDEWDYLDGTHTSESIGWLAVSEGSHTLATGQTIVASSATIGVDPHSVVFGESLDAAVVLAEVTSVNETSALTTRVHTVTEGGFQVQLEEEEAGGGHADETVSWIAIESGVNGAFEAIVAEEGVTEIASAFEFASEFESAPVLLADMQTRNGFNTSTVRLADIDSSGALLFLEEEQSNDSETSHIDETVGYVALSGGLIYADKVPNLAPVAEDDTATVDESAPLTIDVLANDSDADGGTLGVSEVMGVSIDAGETVALSSGARVTLNADQTLDYDQNGAFSSVLLGQSLDDQFSYSIDDGSGGSSSATVTVTVEGTSLRQAIGQASVATVSQAGSETWHAVSFDAQIENAVVVLGPVSSNGSDAVTTRVRNITDAGFEFQIDEWNYLDGEHGVEDVGWMAISAGSHTLANGQKIVASNGTVETAFATQSFGEALTDAIVFAEVTSGGGPDAVATRIHDVTANGFDVQIQEEEAEGPHASEALSWIAIEAGSGSGLEAVRTEGHLDENVDEFVFSQSFADAPVLLADMQTRNGRDTSTVRLADIDALGVSLFVEEEQSADEELAHLDEVAGYLAINDGLIYLDSVLS